MKHLQKVLALVLLVAMSSVAFAAEPSRGNSGYHGQSRASSSHSGYQPAAYGYSGGGGYGHRVARTAVAVGGGAAVGALVGGAATGHAKGALAGAAVGAVAGIVIDQVVRHHRDRY